MTRNKNKKGLYDRDIKSPSVLCFVAIECMPLEPACTSLDAHTAQFDVQKQFPCRGQCRMTSDCEGAVSWICFEGSPLPNSQTNKQTKMKLLQHSTGSSCYSYPTFSTYLRCYMHRPRDARTDAVPFVISFFFVYPKILKIDKRLNEGGAEPTEHATTTRGMCVPEQEKLCISSSL